MDIDSPTQDQRVGFTRSREEETLPSPKRIKIESSDEQQENCGALASDTMMETEAKREEQEWVKSGFIIEDLLPPSRSLLPAAKLVERPANQLNLTFESDVGITEYVSSDVPPIRGIIKQRCANARIFGSCLHD
jgi:tRNA pseudouridine13 synthase